MTVDQLSQQVREFANYLDGLLARLDQGAGWCAVFWQRDPDGMRACLGGRELPPWDVVESLLQDLANAYGPDVALQETERAGTLHRAAVTAHDSRPGAREALTERLDTMAREQRTTAERQVELGRMLAVATTREQSDSLRLDLAWANDDHERATARCAEFRARLRDLDHRTGGDRADGGRGGIPPRRETRGSGPGTAASPGSAAGASAAARRDAGAAPSGAGGAQSGAIDWRAARRAAEGWWAAELDATQSGAAGAADVDSSHDFTAPVLEPAAPQPGADPVPDPADQRQRLRGGARDAGVPEQQAAPEATAPAPAPSTTSRVSRGAARGMRGARFAGAGAGAQPTAPAPEAVPQPGAAQPEPAVPQPDPALPETEDTRAVRETVTALVRLRREGRTGEAHALLVEAAYWPAVRFPLLADLMERAGLTADWVTLLWEAASLPADLLVAAADALVEAGRAEDGQQMLRQGVARPAAEIGGAVLALVAEGRDREVRELLDAYVRVRTPEEAARSADADPRRLAPLLLSAARAISDERHWDLLHALRVAGHAV